MISKFIAHQGAAYIRGLTVAHKGLISPFFHRGKKGKSEKGSKDGKRPISNEASKGDRDSDDSQPMKEDELYLLQRYVFFFFCFFLIIIIIFFFRISSWLQHILGCNNSLH